MKRFKKYIIIICLFVVIMLSILIFFIFRYERLHLKSKARDLLKYVYNVEEGNYKYKYGVLDKEGKIIETNIFIDGNGEIQKDKYGNVRLYIYSNDYCISKTYLGNIEVNENECDGFKDLDVKINKNNTIISFNFNDDVSSYMVSNNDDFNGKWNNIKDNKLILNYFESGKKYIWFKDNVGNISDTLSFEIDCLDVTMGEYNKDLYYCNLSTVIINSSEWIVLDNNKDSITLMKYLPISEKLSHCSSETSTFCSKSNKYRWSNSYINYYLNNIYIDNFKDYELVSYDICDDIDNMNCDNEYCGGYTKDEIENNNWSCNSYTKSKIRILNYYEYNDIANKYNDLSLFKGNYWMSDISSDKGYSSTYNGVYIYEDYFNKLDIRPIITIMK